MSVRQVIRVAAGAVACAAVFAGAGAAAAQTGGHGGGQGRPVIVRAFRARFPVWPAPANGLLPLCTRAERGQLRVWAYASGGPAWVTQCRAMNDGRFGWDETGGLLPGRDVTFALSAATLIRSG